MNIVFTPTAWNQYTEWQKEDKKIVKRINELIKDISKTWCINWHQVFDIISFSALNTHICS